MNIIDRFTRMVAGGLSGRVDGDVYGRKTAFISYYSPAYEVRSIGGLSIAELWATQPHLRTVVDFIAKNVASIGMHVFQREQDGSRTRLRDSPLAMLLDDPNDEQTGPEFLFALALEIALYNEAFVLVAPDGEDRIRARVIPTPWVSVERSGQKVTGFIVNGVRQNMANILHFPAWSPGGVEFSTSPVETLRTILDAENASHSRRRDILVKGPRVGGMIERPKDAPAWTDAARRRFDEMWDAFQPGGARAGDAVLLEDGMKYSAPEWDADAAGYKDGATLSLSTVAQVYHIHPSILGVPGAVGYSGVREIRRALIGDSLSWVLKRIESRFTQKLMPMLREEPGRYAEFNVEAKLRGSFEEQAIILRQSVGTPYMTVNEARRLQNMPDIEDGDELIRPLNVDGTSNRSPEDDAEKRAGEMKADVVAAFKQRRDAVIASKRGAGDTTVDWTRWVNELQADAVKAGFEFTFDELIDANRDLMEG